MCTTLKSRKIIDQNKNNKMYKHLKFPFENSCIVKIKNNKKIEKVTCELADSITKFSKHLWHE